MKQLTGERLPVQVRSFVPDAHGTEAFNAREHLVSRVTLIEKGPDVALTIFTRGQVTPVTRAPLEVPARDADAWLSRLFREAPVLDREVFQRLMDDLMEAAVAVDTDRITVVRRQLMAILDTMAADLAALEG